MKNLALYMLVGVFSFIGGIATRTAVNNLIMLHHWLSLERYPDAYWWFYWGGFTLLDICLALVSVCLAILFWKLILEDRKGNQR